MFPSKLEISCPIVFFFRTAIVRAYGNHDKANLTIASNLSIGDTVIF